MSEKKSSYQHEKRKLWLQNAVIVAVVVGVFGFFVWSTTTGLLDNQKTTHYIDNTALSEYMSEIATETGVE